MTKSIPTHEARRLPLGHLTAVQNLLLKSLLDLLVALAWACWDRLTASQDERRARAAERERPVRRLDPWRVRRFTTHVVAVLVSQSGMEERVRRALGGRANLRFTSTWAELQQLVARVAPSAIVADPVADWRGDPERHLARFSGEWRIPVVLYTALTPQSAAVLLRLPGRRIRHVILHRYDDAPCRFVDAIDWDTSGPPLRAA